MTQPQIKIFENGHQVAEAALEIWLEEYSRASGPYWVSLAGGSTPKELYRRLAEQSADWGALHLLWGDERNVPHDHADSNYRMVKEAFLDRVQGLGGIHPWPILASPDQSAEQYERVLRQLGRGPDLCLLGMGDDGHTASLFPGTTALQEQEHWAVSTWVEKFSAHRLTMTYPYLNLSRNVVFLITGAGKAPVLRQVLREGMHPAAGVRGRESTIFLLDKAAAAEL